LPNCFNDNRPLATLRTVRITGRRRSVTMSWLMRHFTAMLTPSQASICPSQTPPARTTRDAIQASLPAPRMVNPRSPLSRPTTRRCSRIVTAACTSAYRNARPVR